MEINKELKEQVEEVIESKANDVAAEILGQKVKDIAELLKVQREVSNDAYMIGIYNGMELCRAILTGEQPVYLCQDDITDDVVEIIDIEEVNKNENSGQ